MKITTRAVYDMATMQLVEWEGYEYSGEVAECKGDNSKAEMQRANELQASQQNLMQQQLGLQSGQIGQVNSVLDPIIANGGMTPGEESAMNSTFINQLPQDFRQTAGAVNQNLAARGLTGGTMAGGGDVGRQFGNLGAMEDFMKAQGLNGIQMQKANLLRQALGAKMGVAGMFGNNVGLFNNGSLSALGHGVTAANNADQAQTSFMGSLIGGLTGMGSAAITGGFGGAKPPCWVARATFGETNPLWQIALVRWLEKAGDSWMARLTLALYIAFGEPTAWFVKRSSFLRGIAKRLFEKYLLPEVR